MKTLIDTIMKLVDTVDTLEARLADLEEKAIKSESPKRITLSTPCPEDPLNTFFKTVYYDEPVPKTKVSPIEIYPSTKNKMYTCSKNEMGNTPIVTTSTALPSKEVENNLSIDNIFGILSTLKKDVDNLNNELDIIKNPHTDLTHFQKTSHIPQETPIHFDNHKLEKNIYWNDSLRYGYNSWNNY